MDFSGSSDLLSGLPVELLQIRLLNLSVKAVARVRVLNKHLKQVVDANQSSILKRFVASHQARLASYCRSVLDTTGIAFATAFKRYIRNYGEIQDVVGGTDVLMSFCWLYVWQNYMYESEIQGSDATPRHLRDALYYVTRDSIQHLHIVSSPHGDRDKDFSRTTEDRLNGVAEFLDDDTWRHLPQSLVKANISDAQTEDATHGVPSYFLTERAGFSYSRHTYQGLVDWAPIWLGIPQLPFDRAFGRLFGYCVKTHSIWFMLLRLRNSRDTEVTLFGKAAILKELFIW